MNYTTCTIKFRKQVLDKILAEAQRASEIHSDFPSDTIHAVAIMAEEAGEAIRAANDHVYKCNPHGRENLRRELIQTAAMCIRCLWECEPIANRKA